MNDDEKNELEQTQVIEIPEEDTVEESVSTVEIPSMNDVLEPPVVNEMENNSNPEPVSVVTSEEAPVSEEPVQVSEASPVEVGGTATPETQVTTSNVSPNTEFIEKEKKTWPIILLLAILVLGGLFAYYFFIYTKPINIINKLLSTAYSDVKKATNSSTTSGDIDINSFIFDSSLTLTSDNKEYADFSGLNAKAYVAYDLKDNKNNKVDFSLALKDQKMLDLAISMIGNKTYYDLKEAYPKIVYMETDEELMSMDSILIDQKEVNDTVSDSLYILELVKNAIVKNISEEKLSRKMLLKDIDGKKIPAIEVNYKIDYKEYKKLRTAIYDAMISNERALSILAKIDETSESEEKEELTEKRDNISELDLPSDIDVVLDIDALTNKLVAMEIRNDTEKMILRNTSTETNIDYNSTAIGAISVTVDKKENKIFADIKMIIDEKVIRFAVTIKVNEASKYSYNTDLSVVLYDTQDINKEVLTLTGEFKLDLNKVITTVNTVDAVNMKDLTSAEAKKFNAALESLTDGLSALTGAM